MMRRAYWAHEELYQQMRKQGISSWEAFNRHNADDGEIEASTERFFREVLTHDWAPGRGRAIELGCGTGPIARWFACREFRATGIDVSVTAIAMARAQSKGLGVRFRQGDVCDLQTERWGSYDLVVDGHCLHCICRPADRKAFFATAHKLLKPGGVLIVSTMCGPVDRRRFAAEAASARLVGTTVFARCKGPAQYEARRFQDGQLRMPIRYLGHWQSILAETRAAGFHVQLTMHNAPSERFSMGGLGVAAIKPA